MDHSIAKIYHQLTKVKYKKGAEGPPDLRSVPKEWKMVYFKSYPRLPKTFLPKPRKLNFSLGKALLQRRSEREFKGKPLSLGDLSQLLFYSAGIQKKEKDSDKSRRTYASGGARYPLEIYLFSLKAGGELKEGIYHYNIREHSLEKLLEEKGLRKKVYPEAIWQEMIKKTPVVLVISAVFWRNTIKYKDRGYRYILFEAGHVGQNIYLTAAASGLKCCAIGGFDDDKFNEFLDIDGDSEATLYLFALGY